MTMLSEEKLTSELLKSWGHAEGKAFGAALRDGQTALDHGTSLKDVRQMLESYKLDPTIPLAPSGAKPFHVNI